MQIYLDAEFDSISIEKAHYQMIISIGAVMVDHHNCYKYFYSLVKPHHFKRLSRVVKKLTQLEDEDIASSASFAQVMQNFREWISTNVEDMRKVKIYSFGPDDKRTLLSNAHLVSYDCEDLFGNLIDLQKELSLQVQYEKHILSPTLSLEDLKYVYDIEGKVHHNALDDAIDLMQIHNQSKKGLLNYKKVKELMEKKSIKAMEVKQKEHLQIIEEMERRLSSFSHTLEIRHFSASLKEQLNLLNTRMSHPPLRYHKEYVVFKKEKYSYQGSVLQCCICKEKSLFFCMLWKHPSFIWENKIEVVKQNYLVIEKIMKILIEEKADE